MAKWNRLFSEATTQVSQRKSYADCNVYRGDTRVTWCCIRHHGNWENYLLMWGLYLSLLRVSAYKTVRDVYESGKLPSLFNKGSLRKFSPSPIKHPLYTMDWLSYVLTTALALYHPLGGLRKESLIFIFCRALLSCEPSLERLTDTPSTENTYAGINSSVDFKTRWPNKSKWFFKHLKVSKIEPETMSVIVNALKSYFMHQYTTLSTEIKGRNHCSSTEPHNRTFQHECLAMSTPNNC